LSKGDLRFLLNLLDKADANDYYDMQLKDKPYFDRNSLVSAAPVLALAVNWLSSFLYAAGVTHAGKLIFAACLLEQYRYDVAIDLFHSFA
jgi:hypothetical protein